MAHINSFADLFNINGHGKKWYESLEAENDASDVLQISDSLKKSCTGVEIGSRRKSQNGKKLHHKRKVIGGNWGFRSRGIAE
jgi:hypothetical protein